MPQRTHQPKLRVLVRDHGEGNESVRINLYLSDGRSDGRPARVARIYTTRDAWINHLSKRFLPDLSTEIVDTTTPRA